MDATIATKDLKARINSKERVIVGETIAPDRYREDHIPGALNIPTGTDQRTRSAVVGQQRHRDHHLLARTTLDTPALTLPMNWRRWVRRTWRLSRSRAGLDVDRFLVDKVA